MVSGGYVIATKEWPADSVGFGPEAVEITSVSTCRLDNFERSFDEGEGRITR